MTDEEAAVNGDPADRETAPSGDPADAAHTMVMELVHRLGKALSRPTVTAREIADVVGGAVRDDGAPLGLRVDLERDGAASVAVTRKWQSEEPNAAEIRLREPVPLAALEAELGAARSLPRPGPGLKRFTFAGADAAGWSVFAGAGDDGAVRSITVRRDV